MKNCNDIIIYKNCIGGINCKFILVDVGEKAMIPLDSIQWHESNIEIDELCDGYLTLKEIGEQLRTKGLGGVFYVWVEAPIGGRIYQYGNYIADFVYVENGRTIVEDVKSVATAKDKTYIIRIAHYLVY